MKREVGRCHGVTWLQFHVRKSRILTAADPRHSARYVLTSRETFGASKISSVIANINRMQVRLIRQALTDSSGYVCLCCRFRKRSFRNGGIQRRDYADLSTKAEKKDDSGDPPTFSDRVRAFLSSNHTDGASQAVTVIEDTVVPSRKTPNQNVCQPGAAEIGNV